MSARAKAVNVVPYSTDYRAATLAFFARVSPDHPELARGELLDWQRSQRYLALFQDRIVGHIARIPQKFHRDGQDFDFGWAATLVLDGELPIVQTFAGTALLDQLTHDSPYRFAAVGVVPEIEQTHVRRGYTVNRSAVQMYARLSRPSAMLRYLGRSGLFSLPITIVNMLRPARKTDRNSGMREIRTFDPAWDSQWKSILDTPGVLHGVRTAEYINYKLSQPGKEYRAFVCDSPAGRPEAYAIYRLAVNEVKKLRLLKVVDLVGSQDARASLLAGAISEAVRLGVDGVVALDATTEGALYSKAGLWAQKAFPVVLPPDLDGNVRVTFLDSDLDDLW